MTTASARVELRGWLEESYADSVRTAFLLLGNRHDAEDAVQEAFLRAWKFRDSLASGKSFRPWLYRVVVNTCNSKLRHDIPRRSIDRYDESSEEVPTRDDEFERIAASHDLATAVLDLSLPLRTVIVLRYFAELSEREIAIAINRQPGTVKSRLNEARRRLADHPALRQNADADQPHGSKQTG